MRIFFLALALSWTSLGHLAGAFGGEWLDDYGKALQQTKQSGKPLLIVIDRPAKSAVQSVAAKPDHRDELLNVYVLCRIDASTKYGQAVAESFKAQSYPYAAIIDRTGGYIIFSKSGAMGETEWTNTLTQYQKGVQPSVAYYDENGTPVYYANYQSSTSAGSAGSTYNFGQFQSAVCRT